MITLLNSLYHLLCFITEDAQAHKIDALQCSSPAYTALMTKLNEITTELGDYLDSIDPAKGD